MIEWLFYDPDSGKYCGQSHRRCYHQAAKNKYALHDTRKPKDEIDKWIANNQETSLFCADPLLVSNFKDSVRDHDHMTGKNHEKEMQEDMANKRPLAMTNEDWQKHRNETECHNCNKSLVKDLYYD